MRREKSEGSHRINGVAFIELSSIENWRISSERSLDAKSTHPAVASPFNIDVWAWIVVV
jgi:hypothetical protein